MCTVIYIPTDSGHVFTSLRDESPKRPQAFAPEVSGLNTINYLAPKDALANGTWVGVNSQRQIIILLNGGFENHARKKSYRKSRGLIVTELLQTSMPVVEWNLMNMEDIEPFTLVVWSEGHLFQLVWDGEKKHRIRMDENVPHIWSSSTLYNQEAKAKRHDYFQNWIAMHPPVSKLSILNFFNSFDDKENGFIINRNETMKTLSYSFIESSDNNATMDYYDFLTFTHSSKSIDFSDDSGNCFLNNYNTN
jgi:uncharacterized protein with NRDE domain